MGVILGTAAYMARSRRAARPVDKRADIWAFGCVLYEMLTGRRAFAGETSPTRWPRCCGSEPDWTALPADTPPPSGGCCAAASRRIRRQRLRDIGDAAPSLDGPARTSGERRRAESNRCQPLPLRRRPWLAARRCRGPVCWLAWLPRVGSAYSLVRGAAAGHTDHRRARGRRSVGTGRAHASRHRACRACPFAGRGEPGLCGGARGTKPPVPTPDGLSSSSRLLPGTEGSFNPFFSPDGQWIAFLTPTHLRKISIRGGMPETVCDAVNVAGAKLGPRRQDSLRRPGGHGAFGRVVPRRTTRRSSWRTTWGEGSFHQPEFLPDGKSILVSELDVELDQGCRGLDGDPRAAWWRSAEAARGTCKPDICCIPVKARSWRRASTRRG